jgi:formyltetrahydrofolate deformylase
MLIAVSKASHCLNDLLHRWRTGGLAVDIVGVVSNHDTMRALTDWNGIVFHYLPVDPDNRQAQESAVAALMIEIPAEALILARYMQVLSVGFVTSLAGRCINISPQLSIRVQGYPTLSPRPRARREVNRGYRAFRDRRSR